LQIAAGDTLCSDWASRTSTGSWAAWRVHQAQAAERHRSQYSAAGNRKQADRFHRGPVQASGQTTWFDFDRLTFDTGAPTLQPSSAEQLQNITAILKAYPKINATIGGYTDNTGNKDANLKLSGNRATNVMQEFVSRGIDASRLEAKG
jgi:outer membrane protein OmpA-like peptidoglycan-associated protein